LGLYVCPIVLLSDRPKRPKVATAQRASVGSTEASKSLLARVGFETMKEASVSRVTWNTVAAIPRYIDFRRHTCSTSLDIHDKRPGIDATGRPI
jgi:hypothetical protein